MVKQQSEQQQNPKCSFRYVYGGKYSSGYRGTNGCDCASDTQCLSDYCNPNKQKCDVMPKDVAKKRWKYTLIIICIIIVCFILLVIAPIIFMTGGTLLLSAKN